MVRDQIWRRKKYEAKTDGDVAELRLDKYKAQMYELYKDITPLMVEQEIKAKTTILEPAGIATSEIPFYLNAMREFCKCCRQFSSTTRNNKCLCILLQYNDKGLRIDLLYRLAMMCGCYPEGYEYY